MTDGSWRETLTVAEKLALRDRLAQVAATKGVAVPDGAGAVESPGELMVRMNPRMVTRPHLQIVDEALVWLWRTPGAKLMIWLPPQSGKSWLAARAFPFWWLVRNPRSRIILGSYAQSLALGHARAVRTMVEQYGSQFALLPSREEWAAGDWTMLSGGGLRARGVGGGLTGHPADCLSGAASIVTRDGARTIADIVESGELPEVLSFNHETGQSEWSRVVATRAIRGREVVRVTTSGGKHTECTPEHLFHTERGYVPARSLRPGERLTACGDHDVRAMRESVSAPPRTGGEVDQERGEAPLLQCDVRGAARKQPDLDLCGLRSSVQPEAERDARAEHDVLHETVQRQEPRSAAAEVLVQMVQETVRPTSVRGNEDRETGSDPDVLFQGVLRAPGGMGSRAPVSAMSDTDGSGAEQVVLQRQVQDRRQAAAQECDATATICGVSAMRGIVQAVIFAHTLLLAGVRRCRAFVADDRQRELSVYDWAKLRAVVHANEAADPRTRWIAMCRLWGNARAAALHAEGRGTYAVTLGGASHQRTAAGQQGRESDHALRDLPRKTPPFAELTERTVEAVQRLSDREVTVYDLQVAGNSNFFANTILVHNCTIIDDPYRDRQQADSPLIRANVVDWYSSVVQTRKSPGAREVIIHTRWHPNDLSGDLLKKDGRIEDGGKWRVVHLPAIAQAPDRDRGFGEDPMGRAPGEPLTHPDVPVHDKAALLAHWAEKRETVTIRDWGALYQGAPQTAEAALLTAAVVRDRTGIPPTEWRRTGVGIDPSGGGRDSAGIVAGGVDTNGKMWWTHDWTAVMSSAIWPIEACKLAVEVDADLFVIEVNYGGDQATTLLRQAWQELQRQGVITEKDLCPRVVAVHSKKSKVLRAEPIGQAVQMDRINFATGLGEFCLEWTLWEPGSTWSPGALDAGVHLATELLPPVQQGVKVVSVAGKSRQAAPVSGMAAARLRR